MGRRSRAIRDLAALGPRLVGLLYRLVRDPRVPVPVKAVLGVAAAYLASPIDLIPDFVPVLGILDDVLVAAVVIDGILNHVDRAILLDHWPGDAASAVKVLGDEALRTIARELVATVRANVTIDWAVRENVRAHLRVLVKRILRKHGYPPDKQEKATQTVLEQAEVLSQEWAAA